MSATRFDFDEKPFILIWELTQACDLACVHCRASATPSRDPLELTTAEGMAMIDQIAEMQIPVFVITGGDPLKRDDIYTLIRYAVARGVRTSITPSVTPLLTSPVIRQLKNAGIARIALSLDGAEAATHDRFRGIRGAFDRTIDAIGWCHDHELPLQINTTLSRENIHEFEAICELVTDLGALLWSVFFLVPTGRASARQSLSAEEFEYVFSRLRALREQVPFDIKTTEAPHYRRYLLQHRIVNANGVATVDDPIGRAPAVNDGKGFIFVSHRGDVYPSGFLPIACGNARTQSLQTIYQQSPVLQMLRNPDLLEGKCGLCEYRRICGGSRARAYAATGSILGEDPDCVYMPPRAVGTASVTDPSLNRPHA